MNQGEKKRKLSRTMDLSCREINRDVSGMGGIEGRGGARVYVRVCVCWGRGEGVDQNEIVKTGKGR